MKRDAALARLSAAGETWDVLVIGGGATGLGVAVDAAARGYRTALVEQHDFAKGTSSRSTKLAHGGVRYLRSGKIGLVRGALHERGLMERNAPHLVHRQPFVIPVYRAFDLPFYGLGLKAYEWLSGGLSFGTSRMISAAETRHLLPTVKSEGLRGGVIYCDGQFDDARLALALAQTANDLGAVVANYARVERLLKVEGRVAGAEIGDRETDLSFQVSARVVVGAAGIFADAIRRLDEPAAEPMLTVSSGVHLVLDRSFLPGDHALMVPKTSDGRVLFAVPWHDHVVVGTTDELRDAPELEPAPLEREVAFLIEQISEYLIRPVTRADVRSIFTGLRPLVKADHPAATSTLSRDHVVTVSKAGLVTIAGGKWTSYRRMAEDAVNRAAAVGGLAAREPATERLPLHGAAAPAADGAASRFPVHGSDAPALEALIAAEPELDRRLHGRLPYRAVEVVWAARNEMARSVEDVLARRTRALVLDARAAIEAAPAVSVLLARELGKSPEWAAAQVAEFSSLARTYLP